MTDLDTNLLRSFLAIVDTASISGGAGRLGRSQSAVSLQVKRLESLVGKPVFARHSRGIRLTAAGEKLERTARQTIALLDASLADIKSDDLAGKLTLGIPDDYSKTALADIIANFARRHPRIELNVQCAPGTGFADAVARGLLDLAIYAVDRAGPPLTVLRHEHTHWVSSRFNAAHQSDPLPVALFDHECWWREAALNALEESGRDYRVVFASESVAGVAAAIKSGIAVGLMGESSLDRDYAILTGAGGFKTMPVSYLVLDTGAGARHAAVGAMADAIVQAFQPG